LFDSVCQFVDATFAMFGSLSLAVFTFVSLVLMSLDLFTSATLCAFDVSTVTLAMPGSFALRMLTQFASPLDQTVCHIFQTGCLEVLGSRMQQVNSLDQMLSRVTFPILASPALLTFKVRNLRT
jgi:hypothetical protein